MIRLRMTREGTAFSLAEGQPLQVEIYGQPVLLDADERLIPAR